MDEDWAAMGSEDLDLSALAEGIPVWMEARFWPWVEKSTDRAALLNGVTGTEIVAEYDERRRLSEPLSPDARSYRMHRVLQMREDDALTLSWVDYMVAKLADSDAPSVNELEHILSRSGSAWRVGRRHGVAGLERRVALGAQEAAEDLMVRSGDAGKLLSQAWHSAYGVNPDPEKAYSKAIKAVEEAAAGVVTPDDKVATLGKIASAMRDQNNWGLPLEDDPKNPSANVLYKMVRTLHSGQQQRHGGNGDRAANQEEAESAVFLAVTLVQAFTYGLAQRRSPAAE